MSRSHRYGKVLCQVDGCRRRAMRAVEIELPEDWNATFGFRALMVTVGACVDHGRAIERRVAMLLEARVEHYDLVQIIALATETESAAGKVIEHLERDLAEAEGAVDYQRERADRAEAVARAYCPTWAPSPRPGGEAA